MTVLVIAGSSEGIAIAADGRRRTEPDGGEILTAQKIWEAKTRDGIPAVFGWCGKTEIYKETKTFSFPIVTREIMSSLDSRTETALSLVHSLGSGICNKLADSLRYFESASLSGSIAGMAVGWLHNGTPHGAGLSFSREANQVVADRNFLWYGDDAFAMVSGSETVFNNRIERPITTLSAAIESVRSLAQDCVDQRKRISDCAEYGGRVHVGAIGKDGFVWAIPPTPVSV